MAQTIEELMTIEQQATVKVVRFHVNAVFDPVDVDLVDNQFNALIKDEDSPRIVLDLSSVEQVSSMMLSALIEARTMTLERSGRIAISGMHPRLKDLFEIVRIDMLFESYASVESAVVALLD